MRRGDLFDALGPIASAATVARVPKALPIYIFSGSRNPIGDNLQSLIDAYRCAGLKTTAKIYSDARHETLNEINRDQVTADLIAWMNGVIGS